MNDERPDAQGAPLSQDAAAEQQEDETSDKLEQADAELAVGNREGQGVENAGSPSHPQQLHSGPEWQLQNHFGTFPFDYSSPQLTLQHPFPNVFSHVAPPFLHDFPYVYPYAYSAPSLHLAYPCVAPYFTYARPYFAPSLPVAHPNPYLYSAHYDNPSYANFDPHGVIGQIWQREAQGDAFYDETDQEDWSGMPGLNSLIFADSVENIGPLWDGDVYEEFSSSGLSLSFPDDTETPSTSGLGSSARRRKKGKNEEETTTKKPRWSNDDDSD